MQWQMTEWYNPSKSTVELRIFVQPGNVQVYKIPPKGTALISEEYDEAIRATRDGRVVGGLCPWLLKASERPDAGQERVKPPVVTVALLADAGERADVADGAGPTGDSLPAGDPPPPAPPPPATAPEKPARDRGK